MAHLCPTSGAFSDRCNSGHRLAESGVGAPRQDDHRVDALASDRSDQSFGKAVLPRRAWSDRFVADAHGSQSMPDGNAIDLIPIADHVARGLIPRECLCDLTDQRHTSSNRRLDRATEQFEEEAKVLWVALVRCRCHQKIVFSPARLSLI